MSDWHDILHHLFGRFGRPLENPEMRATDQNVDRLDRRLGLVESEQLEIEARLKRLEVQGWRD